MLKDVENVKNVKKIKKNVAGCGGVSEGTSGVIQSPGYPNGYPHRHICRWDIIGPPGRSVKVVFEGKFSEDTF